MLRRIIFDDEAGDEAWLHSLFSSGFTKVDVDWIYNNICDHEWISNALFDRSQKEGNQSCYMDYNFVSQLYRNSWVSQEYIPNVIDITKGSGAGTPLADLLYSMCMSRVLGMLRTSLGEDNLTSVVNVNGTDFRFQ